MEILIICLFIFLPNGNFRKNTIIKIKISVDGLKDRIQGMRRKLLNWKMENKKLPNLNNRQYMEKSEQSLRYL